MCSFFEVAIEILNVIQKIPFFKYLKQFVLISGITEQTGRQTDRRKEKLECSTFRPV